MRTDNKDPLPSRKRGVPVKALIHGRHHDAGEHAAYLSNSGKNGSPFSNLRGFVPRTQDVNGTTI